MLLFCQEVGKMSNGAAGDRLGVYLHERLVGYLWLDERQRFIFQYDMAWIDRPGSIALSLALPLQREPYADDLARPFFANLLPEAEIRRVIARRLRISEKNDFILLRRIGGECAGAVSVLPERNLPQDTPGYRELDESHCWREKGGFACPWRGRRTNCPYTWKMIGFFS
jgi:serine/threonine-protein kinase HipA